MQRKGLSLPGTSGLELSQDSATYGSIVLRLMQWIECFSPLKINFDTSPASNATSPR